MARIKHLGCAGHLIVASRCQYRRHTQVGTRYRVSTVGDYYPKDSNKREPIGASDDAFFETLVFKTLPQPAKDNDGCGCLAVASWIEIDGERSTTAGEAHKAHEKYVRKYARKLDRK